jgi:very-short-patch-repair endonuclease/predicted transcriptional regulator of viral defense system
MNSHQRNCIDAESPDQAIAVLARGQHGVFSWRQAVGAGFHRSQAHRRHRLRRWERLRLGVYRVNGTPDSWRQAVMAACLWAGEGAVASHLTAARLWELEGLPRQARDEPIHVSVPPRRHPTAPDVEAHRPRKLEPRDCSLREAIPVTNLPRTLIDLAAEPGLVKLELALDSALARYRHFDLAWLKKTLARLDPRGRTGAGALQALARARSGDRPDLDSPLERRLHALLLRARLPGLVTHFNLVVDDLFLGELDFAFPEQKVAVLTHGSSIHRRRDVWERDLLQAAEMAALGWKVIAVTHDQLEHDEAGVLARIRRALGRRAR